MSFSNFSFNKHFTVLILLILSCVTLVYGQQEISIKKEEYTVRHADFLFDESRRLVMSYSDSALTTGKKLYAISEAIDYPLGIAKAKEAIARAHMFIKPDSLSLLRAHEAFDYAKSIGADSILLETINLLGAGYYRNKKIHRTFEYNRMGLRYAKEFGNWHKQFLFTANAASIMADLNEYEKAMNFFKETLEILEDHPDSVSYQVMFYNMAKINVKGDSIEKAIINLNNSKRYHNRYTNQSIQLEILLLEADILVILKQLKKASYILKQAEELAKDSQNYRTLADLKLVQTKLYLELKELEKAERLAKNGLRFSEISQYVRTKQVLLEKLYQIKTLQNDFKDANQVLRSSIALRDSIKFGDNQNKLKIALAENNFVKEQEILKLKLRKATTSQKYITIIAVLIILSLLAIIYLVKSKERALKQLNHQLEEKSISLDEANQSKSQLFSIIAHDFKGPITGIKSLVELFLSNDLSQEEFEAFAPKIKSRLNHIQFSLNNLLDWGSGQLEGGTIAPIQLKISEKFKNAIDLLHDKIKTKEIEIVTTISSNAHVIADSNHIEIVLRNLISNSLKFTPNHGKIICDAQEKEDFWLISIKDTGVGMRKSIQDQIFKDRKIVTTFGTNNEEGTGLGLSLCIDLIVKNNGRIWVESNPNAGTKINFTLPKA